MTNQESLWFIELMWKWPSYFEAEDLILIIWLMVVEPYLGRLILAPLKGLFIFELTPKIQNAQAFACIFIGAVLAAWFSLATKSETQEALEPHGCLLGSKLGVSVVSCYILAAANNLLGWDRVTVMVVATFLFTLLILFEKRIGVLPYTFRRMLFTPFILVSSWTFTSPAAFLARDLREEGAPFGNFAVFFLLFLFGYSLFVFAPRDILSRWTSRRASVVRYVVLACATAYSIFSLSGMRG